MGLTVARGLGLACLWSIRARMCGEKKWLIQALCPSHASVIQDQGIRDLSIGLAFAGDTRRQGRQ